MSTLGTIARETIPDRLCIFRTYMHSYYFIYEELNGLLSDSFKGTGWMDILLLS